MISHYTDLGLVPAVAGRSSESRDALLAHTGAAARSILRGVKRLPRRHRLSELDRVMSSFNPALPTRMHKVTEFLHRQGMPVDMAVERALTLSLADASIEKVKEIGARYAAGEGYPLGLGATSSEESSTMMERIACSPVISSTTTDMVGRKEGADAAGLTRLGFEVLRNVAACPPGTVQVPLPPSERTEESSPLVPIVVGLGGLAAVGAIVWFATRRR